jgi:hypothetical protein
MAAKRIYYILNSREVAKSGSRKHQIGTEPAEIRRWGHLPECRFVFFTRSDASISLGE